MRVVRGITSDATLREDLVPGGDDPSEAYSSSPAHTNAKLDFAKAAGFTCNIMSRAASVSASGVNSPCSFRAFCHMFKGEDSFREPE